MGEVRSHLRRVQPRLPAYVVPSLRLFPSLFFKDDFPVAKVSRALLTCTGCPSCEMRLKGRGPGRPRGVGQRKEQSKADREDETYRGE